MRRFYHPEPLHLEQSVSLNESASHHIGRVLRLEPNTHIVVFDGVQGEWICNIEAIARKEVTVLPLQFNPIQRTPVTEATLAIPLIKGDRMDMAIQKATEMGVRRIQLLDTRYTDVRLQGERLEKKLIHWQRIIINACEQCELNLLPELLTVKPLLEWLPSVDTPLRLIAHPGQQPLRQLLPEQATPFTLLTGPEGGFTDEEVQAAQTHGFECITLGERILRAETAPIALLGAIWAQW